MSRSTPNGESGWVTRGRVTSRLPNYVDLSKPAELSEKAADKTISPQQTASPARGSTSKGNTQYRGVVDSPTTSSKSAGAQEPQVEKSGAEESRGTAQASPRSGRAPAASPTKSQSVKVDTQATSKTQAQRSSSPTTLAKPAAASKDTAKSKSTASEAIKVRKLTIDADGTPKGQAGIRKQAESKSPPSGTTRPAKASPKPVSQYVSSAPDKSKLDYTGRTAEPIRLTSSVARMQNMMKQCLRYYYARPEIANERSNWGMLHEIMVYGADTKIRVGNKHYSAIAWIAGNNACRGQRLLTLDDSAIAARSGVGLQGHQAQMLAVFSLCDVPLDYPLYANNEKFSVRDVAESEMLACRRGEELTFTLIGLSHYMDTDTVWLNADGETWSFERLIREELSQSIVGAACGGTHRLMGYAHALRKRRAEGKPITGQWKRAEIYTQDFINYAYRLQNRDGSMSTDWFEGREDNGDMDRKIQTTGHMVEWLLTVTPDSQLQDRRLVNAVRYLLSTMYNEKGHDWKIGPKGHALRSLAMYYERVYKSGSAWKTQGMAQSQSSSRR
ncbi:MAG: hypothetical protein ACR2NZ_12040 [Rubripirellula sp.]